MWKALLEPQALPEQEQTLLPNHPYRRELELQLQLQLQPKDQRPVRAEQRVAPGWAPTPQESFAGCTAELP